MSRITKETEFSRAAQKSMNWFVFVVLSLMFSFGFGVGFIFGIVAALMTRHVITQ